MGGREREGRKEGRERARAIDPVSEQDGRFNNQDQERDKIIFNTHHLKVAVCVAAMIYGQRVEGGRGREKGETDVVWERERVRVRSPCPLGPATASNDGIKDYTQTSTDHTSILPYSSSSTSTSSTHPSTRSGSSRSEWTSLGLPSSFRPPSLRARDFTHGELIPFASFSQRCTADRRSISSSSLWQEKSENLCRKRPIKSRTS